MADVEKNAAQLARHGKVYGSFSPSFLQCFLPVHVAIRCSLCFDLLLPASRIFCRKPFCCVFLSPPCVSHSAFSSRNSAGGISAHPRSFSERRRDGPKSSMAFSRGQGVAVLLLFLRGNVSQAGWEGRLWCCERAGHCRGEKIAAGDACC